MRLSALAFLMILTTVMLSGCAQQTTASLEDKGTQYFGRQVPANHLGYVSLAQESAPSSAPLAVQAPPFAQQNTVRYSPMASRQWQWPVHGRVVQNFGPQRDGVANQGIIIAAPAGEPIHAAQAGEVAYVGKDMRDYGNMVILRHGDGTLSAYSHARNITVAKGQQVAAGGVLGYVGQTGNAKAPQLHFAVREGDRAIDPMRKLPSIVAIN